MRRSWKDIYPKKTFHPEHEQKQKKGIQKDFTEKLHHIVFHGKIPSKEKMTSKDNLPDKTS